jgi:hypothetical protein
MDNDMGVPPSGSGLRPFGVEPQASQAEPLVPNADERSVVISIGDKPVDVDESIAPLVAALNATGFETVASCSGHGFRPGNIALRDGRELVIARSFAEARKIDALFPLDIHGELRPCPHGKRARICHDIPPTRWAVAAACKCCGQTGWFDSRDNAIEGWAAISMEAATAGETTSRLDPKGDSAGRKASPNPNREK